MKEPNDYNLQLEKNNYSTHSCVTVTFQYSETMVYGDISASEQKEAGML